MRKTCMQSESSYDKLAKDSKDASRRSQEMVSKVRDKEETDIETLSRLVKKQPVHFKN